MWRRTDLNRIRIVRRYWHMAGFTFTFAVPRSFTIAPCTIAATPPYGASFLTCHPSDFAKNLGTTITLVLHYSGNTIHYVQQVSAAQNTVNPYVYEKLHEQAGNAGRAFSSIRVEVPGKGLAAASQDFCRLAPQRGLYE
ncbi:hypothetical protein PSPO01_08849 [Paraphaeosphaeria sporulosa]